MFLSRPGGGTSLSLSLAMTLAVALAGPAEVARAADLLEAWHAASRNDKGYAVGRAAPGRAGRSRAVTRQPPCGGPGSA